MLRQNETGVLPGSEVYFNSISATAQRLLYFVNCCGHYFCEQGYQIRREYMDSLLIIMIEKGALEMTYDGKTYTATESDILLLDGSRPQYYMTKKYVDFYWLHVAGQNCFELCEHLTHLHGGILHHPQADPKPEAAIRQLVTQYSTRQTIDEAEQSMLIYNVLCGLICASQSAFALGPPDMTGIVQQTVHFIHAHLRENLSVKRLAARVQVSDTHLIRLFRAELNVSPHEYVVQIRINRARYLLKNTDLPIHVISNEVGYQVETSFTAAFTRRVGLSPRKFRNLPLG